MVTQPHALDARVRAVRLTDTGLIEREQLDRLSDASAASLLEPLDEHQRRRLVTAMREVERLLTTTRVQMVPVDPRTPVHGPAWRRMPPSSTGGSPADSIRAAASRRPRPN